MKKTDKEVLLEIFEKAGLKIFCDDNTNYFEISTNGENVGLSFDSQGNLKELI